MNREQTRDYLCSYYHDGTNWSVTIQAYDLDDAKARVKKLGFLRLDGELMATVPANLGFIAKAIVSIRNYFKI